MNLVLLLLLVAATAIDPTQRAREVLDKAREALGGAKRTSAVRGVSLEAELRRVEPMPGGEKRDMSGDLAIDAVVPDRYLKVETLTPFPGAPAFSIGTGLDGQQAWRAPVGGGGPHIVIRVMDREGAGAAEALLRRTRGEMARLMLITLASAPEDGGLTLAYAGEAEAPEGRADRIDVSDAGGRIGTLFLDQSTHRPLFLSFKTPLPRVQMIRATSPAEAERARGGIEAAPVPEVEARLYVSDWKAVGGILLPHRVSQTIEGGPSEEWTVTKWTLDPAFKPDHFRKPK
jgi:hypothetical protein